jgi:hypothetical protein
MASPMLHTIAALLLVSVASACGDRSPLPLDPGAPSLATREDGHGSIREEFFLPGVDNPCTPAIEAIDLAGIIHGQGSLWDNDHFKSHYNVNLTGVDADGVRYQGTSTGNGKGDFPGSADEDMVISTVISSQGGLPNFVSKIVLHHHEDGSITVDRISEECRG